MADHTEKPDIDNVDYAVLKAFYDLDEPLWKKRVHDYIDEHHYDLPVAGTVSLQTVGRRVDRLKYKRYLEHTITRPENTSRDQIIAYTLTAKGKNALDYHRARLLNHVLMRHLFPEKAEPELEKKVIICLMHEQYGFSENVKSQLFDYDRDSILAFLLIRYAQKEAVEILDQGIMSDYHDVLEKHPDIKSGLGIQ